MKELPAIIYLHGLGSSPESPKARLFADHFSAQGYRVIVPRLSVPSLQQLSVVAALESVERVLVEAVHGGRAVLIGSSFGGFLAVHALRRLPASARCGVQGLVLLAPVLYPWHPREPIIAQEMEEAWQRAGTFPIAEGTTGGFVPVHYRFLEELKQCAADEPRVEVLSLVVHGRRDEKVPFAHSVEFVQRHTQARLVPLEDDHQMMAEPGVLVSVVQEFTQAL